MRFRQAQQDDGDVKKIFNAVERGDHDDYIIRNNLLFKKRDGDILLVVPKSMRTQIIKRMHEQGHFSVAKTEALLRREYFIPSARSKIEKIIQNCVTCILAEKKARQARGLFKYDR